MALAGAFVRASDSRAELGYAQIVAASNTTTAGPVDVTGLSVTVPVVSGHAYLILFNTNGYQSTVANDQMQATITDGSNNRLSGTGRIQVFTTSGACSGGVLAARDTPSTGTKTYKIRIERVTGTGSVNLGAASDRPTWIQVVDLGTAAS